MKIRTIQLNNFRGLKNIELFPNGRSMIIFGKNGTGKSTILRAIRYIIDSIEITINKVSRKNRYKFSNEDLHKGAANSSIMITFEPYNLVHMISYPEDTRTNIVNGNYMNVMKEEFENCLENEVFIYYGIDRYIYSDLIDLNVNAKKIVTAINKKSLITKVDFSSFVYWYRETQEKYYKSIQEKTRSIDYDTNARNCKLFKATIAKILDNCIDMSYEISNENIELVFKFDNGNSLTYKQLSDGERTLVSLFSDIIMRICENNPYVNSPLNSNGIVIIDEIEQHLHLSWQKTILKKLRTVFPNIQFIITTHSPIVLSETSDKYYLVGLKKEENCIVYDDINAVGGYDIEQIISKYFETETDSESALDLKNKFNEYLMRSDFENANKAISDWEALSGPDNVDLEFAKFGLERKKNDSYNKKTM